MKNLAVGKKILVISASIIFAFLLATAWFYGEYRSQLMAARADMVEDVVETAAGMVAHYVDLARRGELDPDEAQRLALGAVKATRFDEDNYLWINDLQPKMIMHPIKPELDGKDLSASLDPSGKALFVEMARAAKAQGAGFVDYQWPKPGFDQPVDKISYVRLIEDWGWVIGAGAYLDDIEAEVFGFLLKMLGVLALVTLGSLAMVYRIGGSISRPLKKTQEMISALENGRLDLRLALDQDDEIGRMAKAMDRFADSLQHEVVANLERLARGDLTFTVTPRDGRDQLRQSLGALEGQLNQLMGEIRQAGEQIAQGSEQVSEASQTLAMGATDQASSMEEISSAMAELGFQTKLNAENAGEADQQARESRAAAEKGQRHMKNMVEAMAEIGASGQSISKIIKTIDEIAFQTNLLALNAAVEAARAGQHGKGFAVVAEEVRNLAARSAKAAKETSELIEAAVARTENGSEIAGQTAGALDEIVAGVSKVSTLVAEIAEASSQQAEGINQANEGLGRIDQSIQTSNASAQESSAAAQELAGQSQRLRQMLSRFRVKAQGPATAGAGAGPKPLAKGAPPAAKEGWGSSRESRGSQSGIAIALDDSEFGRY